MKRVFAAHIAFSAVMAAVSLVFLYLSCLIGGLRLSLCALAGLPIVATALRQGRGAAGLTYAAAGLTGLIILPFKSVAVLFLLFFGLYPIAKSFFEAGKVPTILSYVLKIGYLFAVGAVSLFLVNRFGLISPEIFSESPVVQTLGSFLPALLIVSAVAVFFLYDFALTGLITWFEKRIAERRIF